MVANGGIKSDDDVCTAAGMMFVAHQMRSADTAKQWRDGGGVSDSQGKDGAVYYNHGRYAIDILAAGGAATTVAQTAGLSGENTTGINPDDVFVFSGTTGSRSNFEKMNGQKRYPTYSNICRLIIIIHLKPFFIHRHIVALPFSQL